MKDLDDIVVIAGSCPPPNAQGDYVATIPSEAATRPLGLYDILESSTIFVGTLEELRQLNHTTQDDTMIS